MSCRFWHIDAFSNQAYKGNPAFVALLDAPPADEAILSTVASEFGRPINAFVWADPVPGRPEAGGSEFVARFFTPSSLIPLSGHGALSAGHTLWEAGLFGADESVTLLTLAGRVKVSRDGGGFTMLMPAYTPEPAPDLAHVPAALGLPADSPVLRTIRSEGIEDYLVVLPTATMVAEFQPDQELIANNTSFGLILTAQSAHGEADFVSRFFAPNFGVLEDWVTGISHSSLFPFWAGRLGKVVLRGHQISRRDGYVGGRIVADGVLMSGDAVTLATGTFTTLF